MNKAETLAIGERFFAGIETGNIADVRNCYADDAVIWHNNGEPDQTAEENCRLLAGLVDRTDRRSYNDRRIDYFEGGLVQQHVAYFEFKDGTSMRVKAACIFRIVDSKITRLDEYFALKR